MAPEESPRGGCRAGQGCLAQPSPSLLCPFPFSLETVPSMSVSSAAVSGVLVTRRVLTQNLAPNHTPKQKNFRPKQLPNLAGSYLPGWRWDGGVDAEPVPGLSSTPAPGPQPPSLWASPPSLPAKLFSGSRPLGAGARPLAAPPLPPVPGSPSCRLPSLPGPPLLPSSSFLL